jgi:hypothetical protein
MRLLPGVRGVAVNEIKVLSRKKQGLLRLIIEKVRAAPFPRPFSNVFGPPGPQRCPLSRSLLGVKRTWRFALHMSANDPKRTLVSSASEFV